MVLYKSPNTEVWLNDVLGGRLLEEQFDKNVAESVQFVIGGLKSIPEESNDQVSLIVYDPSDD